MFLLRQSASWRSIGAAVVATAVVHIPMIRRALGPDEGGFLVLAEHWREPGPFLFGPLWVDRPHGLIAVFALADQLGPYGARLLAMVVAICVVVTVGLAADAIAGPRAAGWAAWTAAGLTSTVLLQSHQLTGELVGAAILGGTVWLLMLALRTSDKLTAAGLGFVAGVGALAAVIIKQNTIGPLVFATMLAAVFVLRRRWTPTATVLFAACGVGGAIAVAGQLWWAARHGGLEAFWYAVFGFRADAAAVMGDWSWDRPAMRLGLLLLLMTASLMLPLAIVVALHFRKAWRSLDPLGAAALATVAAQVVALLPGINFWPHYVIAFIPMLAIGAGLAAESPGYTGQWTRALVIGAVASAAIINPAAVMLKDPDDAWQVGTWVQRSADRSDTIIVAYTHPNVLHASELRPAYPYLWSLPIRTRDPELRLMAATLNGAQRPTWFVQWDPLRTWHLDDDGNVREALRTHYRRVGEVCDRPIWLRAGVSREFPPIPRTCGGGAL